MSLDILTPVYKTHFRDFRVSNANRVNPDHALTFEQGDWWTLDPANTNQIIPVGTTNATIAFPIWSKRGEGSTQVLTQLTTMFLGSFLADTDRYNATPAYATGDLLTCYNGVLEPQGTNINGTIHGIVVLAPASNSNMLRFVRMIGGALS
jgi:hypothetical protein